MKINQNKPINIAVHFAGVCVPFRCCCRYQFVRFGREGYNAINKTMYEVMVMLREVRQLSGCFCKGG
jgi:hypothetical protein